MNILLLVVPFFPGPFATPASEAVAKSLKALNHEGHEGHKGKEKLFFVLFVFFVVQGFYASHNVP